MFQFGEFASTPKAWISRRQVARMGCPIRTPADQRFFAAPHGFSQLGTSFIATVCLGIHRTPFSTFNLHGLHKALPPRMQSTLAYMSSICYLDLKKIDVHAHAYTYLIHLLPLRQRTTSADSRASIPTPAQPLRAAVRLNKIFNKNKNLPVELQGFEPAKHCFA